MNKTSRRSLARWAAGQIINGVPAKSTAKRLAAAMIENKMADQVGFLLEDILWELENAGELSYAKVYSAQPLTKQLEAELKNRIKKTAKTKQVVIEKAVDKSAIGGVRVETSSRVWDQTIARKLAELKEAF